MKTVCVCSRVCVHVESGRGGFVLNILIAVLFSGIKQSYAVVAELLLVSCFVADILLYSTVKSATVRGIENGILICVFLEWPFYTVLYLLGHFLQFTTTGRVCVRQLCAYNSPPPAT